MEMQWDIARPNPEIVRLIQQHLKCHTMTATVLANRGVASTQQADAFIRPGLNTLPSPMALDDMAKATRRIHDALMTKEKILVFGDYDVDGVTATALLTSFLNSLGASAYHHIPHRIQEGYGLRPSHITQLAAAKGIGLIITVDCGSSSHEAVDAAKRFGIDVIITDHHSIGSQLPGAVAVINPKRENQPPEFQHLAGVGVAFYLACGLRMYLREQGWWAGGNEPNLRAMCDMVALGTVADIVPLKGVNRVLTNAGLEQINRRPRPGIQALITACGIHRPTVTSEDIAFRLAPRINAAGRMAHAILAFELLDASGLSEAVEIAETLNKLNQRRQAVENGILEQIITRMESRPEFLLPKSLLFAGNEWHEGVLGIVASKLVGRYYRPVIVISTKDGTAKGSARSIPEVDLYEALGRCEDVLNQYGGHRMAAGLSLPTDNIAKLKTAFDEAVIAMTDAREIKPILDIDYEIRFDEISPELMDELETLAPFGADNPPPLLMARDIRVTSAAIVGQRHRRMTLQQAQHTGAPLSAIQFNLLPETPRNDYFDQLAFKLQWHHYKSNRQIQLVVEAV